MQQQQPQRKTNVFPRGIERLSGLRLVGLSGISTSNRIRRLQPRTYRVQIFPITDGLRRVVAGVWILRNVFLSKLQNELVPCMHLGMHQLQRDEQR